MDIESKLIVQRYCKKLGSENSELIPSEFRFCFVSSEHRPFLSSVGMSIGSAFFGYFFAATVAPFFSNPFAPTQVALRASSLPQSEGLGFVSFLDRVDDLSGSRTKDMFGWGSLDLVFRAAQAIAPQLQNCRARLQNNKPDSAMTFRFDVKIDVAKPGFLVTGLLTGQEQEPDVATCLRDTINTLQIADFSTLRAAPPKSYKLSLGIQLAHGADGGAQ